MPDAHTTTRVLLVEDDQADLARIRSYLGRAETQRQRFEFVHQVRLEPALNRLAMDRVDVMLVDLNLPDSQGLDTVARAVAAAPDIPVIVLTEGEDDERFGLQAVQLGAQDYLAKETLDGPQLVRSLRLSRERQRMRVEAQQDRRIAYRTEQRLQSLLEQLPDGVALLEPFGGQVLAANTAALEALDRLVGGAWAPQDGTLGGRKLDELLEETARGGWSELTVVGPESRTYEAGLNLLMGDGESAPRAWLFLRDVTLVRGRRRHAERQHRLAALRRLAGRLGAGLDGELALAVGHAARPELLAVDLASLVTTWFGTLAPLFAAEVNLRLEDLLADVRVSASPVHLRQALTNLALNARDAMPDGGELTCDVSSIDVEEPEAAPVSGMEPGPWAAVSLADTGPGIPAELLDHIFEPFVSSRPDAAGLGLAQVYAIARTHGGYVDAASQRGAGAVFTLYLPENGSEPVEAEAASPSDLPHGNGEAVLVVEDEADVREELANMVRRLGYRALLARDAQEALPLCAYRRGEIACVLIDAAMPGIRGAELGEMLLRRHKGLRAALLTAHDLSADAEDHARKGIEGWLRKPVTLADLAARLERLVGRTR